MTLRISSELRRQLLAEAAASPDCEVCGLLMGDKAIQRIVPTKNVASDRSTTFEIDPAALFAAIRAERAGGQRLLGYYHSHPTGSAIPSARDKEQAVVDGRVWLIIGGRQVRAWRFTGHSGFAAIDLIIEA